MGSQCPVAIAAFPDESLELLQAVQFCIRIHQSVDVGGVGRQPSQQFNWTRVVLYAMAALSLTVLTGWSGQLSIGQFAFVGLGGMTAAALVRVDVGPGPALLAATLIGAAAAVLVGLPSLRLPGLFVAVSTLALGVATASWLLSRSFFLHGEPAASLPRLIIGDVSLESQRTYYFVCLVFLLAAMFAMSRLRRTGIGRAFIAVRSNQAAAASFGLSPTRTKLMAFAISGGLAGLSGALLAGLLVTIPPDRFSAAASLQLVSIAVIGGLASVPGAVLGALYVVGIRRSPANSTCHSSRAEWACSSSSCSSRRARRLCERSATGSSAFSLRRRRELLISTVGIGREHPPATRRGGAP
jgi:ABC-type branched-subunit amino acid transport system permease subunit